MDREVKRKILHAVSAVAAVPFLLFFSFLLGVAMALLGVAVITLVWALERRGRQLKGPAAHGQELIARTMENTMREGEEYPWASIYFLAGLLLVAGLSEAFAVPLSMAFAAYAVLGIGDSASALIGKAYGTLSIPWNRKKSWEGTGAGVGAAYPWALMLATIFYLVQGTPFPGHMAWIIFVGTLVGMFAETLPGQDNFTIPVASWAAMWGLAATVGLA